MREKDIIAHKWGGSSESIVKLQVVSWQISVKFKLGTCYINATTATIYSFSLILVSWWDYHVSISYSFYVIWSCKNHPIFYSFMTQFILLIKSKYFSAAKYFVQARRHKIFSSFTQPHRIWEQYSFVQRLNCTKTRHALLFPQLTQVLNSSLSGSLKIVEHEMIHHERTYVYDEWLQNLNYDSFCWCLESSVREKALRYDQNWH